MPKFSVTVERTETYSTTLTVEAPSEEACYEIAEQLASDGKDQSGGAIDWSYEDEAYEVTSVDEEGEEDDEEEEDKE